MAIQEVHAVSQAIQDKVEFLERGKSQVSRITRQASLSLFVKASQGEKNISSLNQSSLHNTADSS